MAKYDWETIGEHYIAGKVNPQTGTNEDYSFGEICRKFGIKNKATVKAQCDKRGWNADREAYKRKNLEILRDELREANRPTIIEIRQLVLQTMLATLKLYVEELKQGNVEVKPLEALKAGEFIVREHHFLYGEEKPEKPQELNVHMDFGNNLDDIYSAAAEYIRNRADKG